MHHIRNEGARQPVQRLMMAQVRRALHHMMEPFSCRIVKSGLKSCDNSPLGPAIVTVFLSIV